MLKIFYFRTVTKTVFSTFHMLRRKPLANFSIFACFAKTPFLYKNRNKTDISNFASFFFQKALAFSSESFLRALIGQSRSIDSERCDVIKIGLELAKKIEENKRKPMRITQRNERVKLTTDILSRIGLNQRKVLFSCIFSQKINFLENFM